jgi:hypothetical protein
LPSYGPLQTNSQFRGDTGQSRQPNNPTGFVGDTGFSRLSAFVSLNPEIDFDQMDRQAQDAYIRLRVAQGELAPGTTINDILGTTPGEGRVRQQTINGQKLIVNEQGQRFNEQGQLVWDPKEAETDVYGDKFRYAGETRWTTNKAGRRVKQVLTKGNKWVTLNKGAGKRNQKAQQPQQRQEPLATTSFGVVSFNVGTG